MGKKKNKIDTGLSAAEDPKGYVPRYFSNFEWTGFDKSHLVKVPEGGFAHCEYVMAAVDGYAKAVSNLDFESGWNVTLSREKFEQMAVYELTNVFARSWLDYHIDRLADALYITTYRNAWANTTLTDTQKRDREADKAGLEIQNNFLSLVDKYNKDMK